MKALLGVNHASVGPGPSKVPPQAEASTVYPRNQAWSNTLLRAMLLLVPSYLILTYRDKFLAKVARLLRLFVVLRCFMTSQTFLISEHFLAFVPVTVQFPMISKRVGKVTRKLFRDIPVLSRCRESFGAS